MSHKRKPVERSRVIGEYDVFKGRNVKSRSVYIIVMIAINDFY